MAVWSSFTGLCVVVWFIAGIIVDAILLFLDHYVYIVLASLMFGPLEQ